ncbi:MAG: DUF4446 family protein [Anaerolineae bacterium]|jgi:hypothetical protein
MDTTQLIWIIAVTILSLLNIAWQFDLQTRLRRLRDRYKQLPSLEGVDAQGGLEVLVSHIEELQGRVGQMEALTAQVQSTLGHSIQGFGIVRFQAYPETGGDQSFALALVDGDGNGVILSALYGRDDTRVYGKPLAGWTSSYGLGDEEKEALERARAMAESS